MLEHIENNNEEIISEVASKVRVALRVRPMVHKELIEGAFKCIKTYSDSNEIVIGKDKNFTFDYIFDEFSKQEEIYKTFAKDLVLGCFLGYNATILAYGQTGSGKTYTMGSSLASKEEDEGIIGRVIKDIFNEIDRRKEKIEFGLKVSFLEIYNEEIYDLLDPLLTTSNRIRNQYGKNNVINIREEKDGSINIYGMSEEKVSSIEEMQACLERGALHRSTASTLMNEVSSRSHAIFTIFIEQHQITEIYKADDNLGQEVPSFMTAKFHFVDLAGSERIKKTGATGSVLKEGININRGLLVLGNVIAALTDTTSTIIHVPYRESKLTRILQDSLGGNSLTGMIACVSPSESNYEESLNTIKYASRARNIKNTPHVNRDPMSAIVTELKQEIFMLQNENLGLRRLLGVYNVKTEEIDRERRNSVSPIQEKKNSVSPFNSSGIKNSPDGGYGEELKKMKIKLVQLEKINNHLVAENLTKQKKLNELEISYYTVVKDRDLTKMQTEKYVKLLQSNNLLEQDAGVTESNISILEDYQKMNAKLQQELMKKEEFIKELQIEFENLLVCSKKDHELLIEKTKNLSILKRQLTKMENTININNNTNMSSIDNDPTNMPTNFESINEEDEDEELLKLESEIAMLNTQTEFEIGQVNGTLSEKEELLRKITENHMELEKNLVETMQNQYYEKISHLESELGNLNSELKKIETQRDKALSKLSNPAENQLVTNEKNKVILSMKSKVNALEAQLKDFRKKEKEQNNLDKTVQTQRNKISDLANEIKNIKQQKIVLYKKYKEDLDKFEKYKTERLREKMVWKKKDLEKENQIVKLKNEKERMHLVIRKKDEEIVNNKKSQELFRNLCNRDYKPNQTSNNPRYPLRRKGSNNSNNVSLVIDEKGNFNINSEFNEEAAYQLIEIIFHRIEGYIDIQQKLKFEEEELKKTENDLDVELKKQSEMLLKKERIQIRYSGNSIDLEEEENEKQMTAELENQIAELTERIESLEDKIDFVRGKISDLLKKRKHTSLLEIETLIFKSEKLNSLISAKLLIKSFLLKMNELLEEMAKIRENLKGKSLETVEVSKKYQKLAQELEVTRSQYEAKISQITKENEEQMIGAMQQIEMFNFYNSANNCNNGLVEDKANINTYNGSGFERNSNNHHGTQDKMEIERKKNIMLVPLREQRKKGKELRKNNNIDELDNIQNVLFEITSKNANVKEKEKRSSPVLGIKRENENSTIDLNSSSNEGKKERTIEEERSFSPINYSLVFPEINSFANCQITSLLPKQHADWSLMDKINFGHPISTIKIFMEKLYITSGNLLQVFDLEKMKVYKELQLDGNISSIAFSHERKTIMISQQNLVEFFDINSFNKTESIKSRCFEIKALLHDEPNLIIAGKGSISRGGLCIYDLRNKGNYGDFERNADILSISKRNNILTYAGIDKTIKRIDLDSRISLTSYPIMHKAPIFSIFQMDCNLISCSYDQTIKLWDNINTSEPSKDSYFTNCENFHVESLHEYLNNSFALGDTFGNISIIGIRNSKFTLISNFAAHESPILCLTKTRFNNNFLLLSSSSDGLIKFWQEKDLI